MALLHENFSKMDLPEHCICGDIEDISHIYYCEILNSNTHILPYHYIFNGSIEQQVSIYKRMKTSMEHRMEYIDIFKSK